MSNVEYLDWIEPRAGALCCIKLRESLFDDDQVAEFYRSSTEQNIQLAKGDWFGETKRCFRLGFGYMSLDKLEKTLELLTGIIRAL